MSRHASREGAVALTPVVFFCLAINGHGDICTFVTLTSQALQKSQEPLLITFSLESQYQFGIGETVNAK